MDRLEAMSTFLAVVARKRPPRAATKEIMVGLSALLLAEAQFPYASVMARETIGPPFGSGADCAFRRGGEGNGVNTGL